MYKRKVQRNSNCKVGGNGDGCYYVTFINLFIYCI